MRGTTEQLFSEGTKNEKLVLSVFHYQYKENKVYSRWVDALNIFPENINTITDIPFLPVSFFKTNKIVCGNFEPQQIFESSGTTATANSRHFIKDIDMYKQSFRLGFEMFYGDIKNWCVIGLLPSYLERKNSSLIMMVEEMIKISSHPQSGFYLYNFDKLYNTLQQLENAGQKTLLIGVSFALLDFSEIYSMNLQHTIVMETGGMKGRRKELTRQELHDIITKKLGI
ncbi:MAG: acyl transferase, partial [Chitinophagaceae bacterium]|nr:acyl transferase [Chitinophagaceae bacterium]